MTHPRVKRTKEHIAGDLYYCYKCEKFKHSSCFRKLKSGKFYSPCRACKSDMDRVYASAHKETAKENSHRAYMARKEEKLALAKIYYEANKSEILAKCKEYRAKNITKIKARTSEYLEKTRAAKRTKDKADRITRRDFYLAKDKRTHLRRKAASGSFTTKQWMSLVSYYCPDGLCLCCGEKKMLTLDHVIPLVIGGTNDIANLQPICMKCNRAKWTNAHDYRPDNGKYAEVLGEQNNGSKNYR